MARTKAVPIDTLVFNREPLSKENGDTIIMILDLLSTAILRPREFHRALDSAIPLSDSTVNASAENLGTDPNSERREIQGAVLWAKGQLLRAVVRESEITRLEMYAKPMGVDIAWKAKTEEAQRRIEAKRKGERAALDEMVRGKLGDEVTDGLFGIDQPQPGVADYDPYLYQRMEVEGVVEDGGEELGPIGAGDSGEEARVHPGAGRVSDSFLWKGILGGWLGSGEESTR